MSSCTFHNVRREETSKSHITIEKVKVHQFYLEENANPSVLKTDFQQGRTDLFSYQSHHSYSNRQMKPV